MYARICKTRSFDLDVASLLTLTGPEDTGGALRYTFNRAIGSKG
jgi:hypothetical protein